MSYPLYCCMWSLIFESWVEAFLSGAQKSLQKPSYRSSRCDGDPCQIYSSIGDSPFNVVQISERELKNVNCFFI